jgi:hypothetical protein
MTTWCLSSARNPFALPKVFGALAVALIFLSQGDLYSIDWIHADSGHHSATVALFLAVLLSDHLASRSTPLTFLIDIHCQPTHYAKNARVMFSVHEFGRRWLAKTGELTSTTMPAENADDTEPG